jgi:PiT family inorganic phosphate transporter
MTGTFETELSAGRLILLVVALLIVFGFEIVNGFHDTANAVATVIYTRSLRPWVAVVWSGFVNFMGVSLGGIAVAMSIIKLLPVEVVASSGTGAGLAMVLALLTGAILWNLGTWYLGLPASSSHTLIGAIVGVGLAHSLAPGHAFGSGVSWKKVEEIGLSLIVSPLFGLTAAALLLLLMKKLWKSPTLHKPADDKQPPPLGIRATLIATCTGVSFAHGSNDGQKGVGLVMLILIGILPADYALNTAFDTTQIKSTVVLTEQMEKTVRETYGGPAKLASNADDAPAETPEGKVLEDLASIRRSFQGKSSVKDIPVDERWSVRTKIMRVDANLNALEKDKTRKISPDRVGMLKTQRGSLRGAIDYAPRWVLVGIALALGIGTMFGWKRIVVTVGEKIGKSHLTYSQGASAELVAAATIGLAGGLGLPVSTTHVLSSGIAGTMLAQKAGLQRSTVRNILLAWVLTLPASMLLSGALFVAFSALIAPR